MIAIQFFPAIQWHHEYDNRRNNNDRRAVEIIWQYETASMAERSFCLPGWRSVFINAAHIYAILLWHLDLHMRGHNFLDSLIVSK